MWEYSHEGKQLENKWVFRRLQKTGKVCADVLFILGLQRETQPVEHSLILEYDQAG